MSLVTLLISLAFAASGQAGTASAVGSWTAQFEGTTFVRLELSTANGAVTGGISLGNIEVDEKGALRRVKATPPGLKPISDVTARGSVLTFLLKEGDEPDRFELRLLDRGHAELHVLLSEDDLEELKDAGVPAPRPIVLTKQ